LSETIQAAGGGRERVSACLIVQDEQRNLPGALASVSFCDEVIVVDGGSADRTVQIALDHGATVIENPWPGFAAQRNVALDAATGEWVLELDADERVTPYLRASIEQLIASPPARVGIAVLPLRHWFLGRLLGPSGKYPAYRSRLFRPDAYRHDESREVHEGIEPRERPLVLEGDLEHELARTLVAALRDAWRYALLESGHLARPSSAAAYLKGIALRPAAKLLYRTIVEQGWRDRWQGMLKIFLDTSSDALVWVLLLLGRGQPPSVGNASATAQDALTDAESELPRTASTAHFGRRPSGPPKVVALAGQGASAEAARRWLGELQQQGFDVALVSDEVPPASTSVALEPNDATPASESSFASGHGLPGEVSLRHVRRLRPLETMRALDVEMQVRTIHAVVPFGRRARRVWRLLPGTLRPRMPGLDAESEPTLPGTQASKGRG
jgi:(heptosyl)LPS beta-1,4-glucosyltransferase